jgi:hypothetical protein
MTLIEISALYDASAAAIRARIRQLEEQSRRQTDPETLRTLHLRIDALTPLLREMREMTFITAHYYDR